MSGAPVPGVFAADFAAAFSIEATRPSAADIAAIAAQAGPGRRVYLSAIPTKPLSDLLEPAILLRRAGLEPVIHLPARRIGTAGELAGLMSQLRSQAYLRAVLAIAGDVESSGIYPDVLAMIRDGELQRAGIREVGLAGYPEGHPRIAAGKLAEALHAKLAAAADTGLRAHIVTQFAFSAEPVIAWVRQLRQQGVTAPVRAGIAGPTKLSTLLRYAKRCGVNASIKGFMSGAAAGLIGNVGPERIIDDLAAAEGLGDIALHYFSFGGIAETARYACEQAMRRTADNHVMTITK